MGDYFFFGYGACPEDNKQAVEWYEKAVANDKKSGSDAVYNYAEKTAYWPIKIAATNEMAAATAEYLKDGKIHRNIIYSIDATLAGRGYDDPTVPPTDFVELFVKTKVLDWGSANQSSVVE